MRIDFLAHKGEVLIVFDEPYKSIAWEPKDARDFGEKLIDMANKIDAAQGQGSTKQ